MAQSLNKTLLIGNLTRDPESRTTPTGQIVTTFTVATNRSWNNQAGERQERSEFHNVVSWGKLAEIVSKYLTKGRRVYVEGRLQTRDWTGQDGLKRYRTEIIAESVIMLDRPSGAVGGGPFAPKDKDSAAESVPEVGGDQPFQGEPEIQLENIPF